MSCPADWLAWRLLFALESSSSYWCVSCAQPLLSVGFRALQHLQLAAGLHPVGQLVAHADRYVELSGCCLLPHSGSRCAWQCCLCRSVPWKRCLCLTPLILAAFMYVLVPMPYLFFGSANTSSSSIYGSSNAVASG